MLNNNPDLRPIEPKKLERARIPILVGLLALAALLGGLGYWSATTKISGAIISSGVVVVERNRQVVQHLDGGIVDQILIRNGDKVALGDPLIELDARQVRAELDIVSKQLLEFRIRGSRLRSERFDLDEVDFFPDVIATAKTDPETARQMESEIDLFEARRTSAKQETDSLQEQIAQMNIQFSGTMAQITALKKRLELIKAELGKRRDLFEKGLAQSSSLLDLEVSVAAIQGDIGKLEADGAAAKGKIEELQIALAGAKTKRIGDVIAEDRDIQFQQIELAERKAALAERLSRMTIRAPASGTVFDLRIFAEGAVVRPGEDLLYILPTDKPLLVSARLEPINIDEVTVGQEAALRFSAFDQRTTPELKGAVSMIAPDALADPTTGISYFPIELIPDKADLAKLSGNEVRPGMPVEVFIKTRDRTPLQYLTKPLTDYFARAFRG